MEEAAEPAPRPGEVKIRVHNCSTCGTDVKIFNHGHPNLSPPRVIGHEIAGEVILSTVDSWRPGDRVQVIAAVPCGECQDCRYGSMTVWYSIRSAATSRATSSGYVTGWGIGYVCVFAKGWPAASL